MGGKYMKSCTQDAFEYMDYLEAAVWTEELAPYELSNQALEKAKLDWYDFFIEAEYLIEGFDLKQVAHDFWLTRNNHGSGFWDGEYCDSVTGELLTQIAESFGNCEAFIGPDKLIYLN